MESAEADDVHLLLPRGFQDLLGWHHDPRVDDLVVVAGQDHTDDVLANVMYIAL